MINTENIPDLLDNGVVVDESGDKIGNVEQVYLDDQSGSPEWVTTKTGLFGGSESFVPVAQASVSGSEIRVPYTKDKIKDAPRMDDDGHLSPEQEQELYRYYGLGGGDHDSDVSVSDDNADYAGDLEPKGYDTSGPTTDEAMTRSEEQLRVGTEKVSTGKARLRKYVVSENVSQTVPVQREEVRVEREPITEANRDQAMAGPAFSEEEHELELTEERVVVDKETVPVERVRLDTETITEQQQVSEEVRREEIETDLSDVDQSNRRSDSEN